VTVKAAAAAMMLLMMPSGGVAEPTVLSDSELDAITAAGVLVDVRSVVAAFGDATRTLTDAKTFAIAGEGFDLGVGRTVGQALACCGEEADVEVGSAVFGVGNIVRRSTRAVKNGNRFLVHGLSAGFVVAVSFDGRLAALRDVRPALPAAVGE
jgi:hypothetical protein